jgi:hypothetical protein
VWNGKRVESHEPDEEADPGNAVAGLGVILMERPANQSVRGYVGTREDSYVEQVDRALEQYKDREDKPHGSPRMAPFGEMVARRGVKRISDWGMRIAE